LNKDSEQHIGTYQNKGWCDRSSCYRAGVWLWPLVRCVVSLTRRGWYGDIPANLGGTTSVQSRPWDFCLGGGIFWFFQGCWLHALDSPE